MRTRSHHSMFKSASSKSLAVGVASPDNPPIRQAVTAGRNEEAARLLLAAIHAGIAPRGRELSAWLRSEAGDSASTAMADGFARMSSFCCRTGFENCDACDGTGFSSGTCNACAGLGRVRCQCCGGTALYPYEDVPDALVAEVVDLRISLICMIFQRIALPDAADPAEAGSRIVGVVRMLQNIEKLLGVLDNSNQALTTLPRTPQSQIARLRIKTVSLKLRSMELEPVLSTLAAAWGGREPTDAISREQITDRAAFYQALVDSHCLRGTGLARPMLFAEDRERADATRFPTERGGAAKSSEVGV